MQIFRHFEEGSEEAASSPQSFLNPPFSYGKQKVNLFHSSSFFSCHLKIKLMMSTADFYTFASQLLGHTENTESAPPRAAAL